MAKAKGKTKKKSSASKGLSPQLYSGLSEKRMKKKEGFGQKLIIEKGSTVPVQFLTNPDGFLEYDVHVWQEDGWNFVPCAGKHCPIDDYENERAAKKNYQFMACVYNLESRKVQYLVGPKDLARRIFQRYKRKKAVFLKKVFEITKFPTDPISYQFELAEEAPVSTKGLKLIDLEEKVLAEMKRYYGDEMPDEDDLEDDEDMEETEEEEEEETEDEESEDEESEEEDLEEMSLADLKEKAEELDLSTKGSKKALIARIQEAQEGSDDEDDDEDESDDDDEESDDSENGDDDDDDNWDWDDDEEEEEEEEKPKPKKKSAGKKKPTTKKKSTTKRKKK